MHVKRTIVPKRSFGMRTGRRDRGEGGMSTAWEREHIWRRNIMRYARHERDIAAGRMTIEEAMALEGAEYPEQIWFAAETGRKIEILEGRRLMRRHARIG